MSRPLQERSKNLTAISLQSFISDITAEGQNHSFADLLDHPNLHTIKPQYQHLINLFAFGTYGDYLQKTSDVPKLNEKQIDTLKRLTVLTAFRGIQSIFIAKLQQLVGLNSNQVIDLLVSMNISGLINAKIDEQKGTVLILAAEIRAEKANEDKAVLNARIDQILRKNNEIEEKVVAIQKEIE